MVILTSSKEEQDLIKHHSVGGNRYIRKPVGFTELLKAVRQLQFYRLVFNEQLSDKGGFE